MKSINEIQNEILEWQNSNFEFRKPHEMYLGLIEEVGELAHARMKYEHEYYPFDYYYQETKDAIGDIAIQLIGLCSQHYLNFEEVLNDIWNYVKTRNSKEFKEVYQRKAQENMKKGKVKDDSYIPYSHWFPTIH
jgi:NTP pyrophosphatase (non-canonical NTP hydrolase)